MNMSSLFMLAETTATNQNAGGFGALGWILYFVIIIAALYFILIRPQRKKKKEEEQMKNNTQVGDEILSIGGIYGKIIAVKEDSYIVETGPDRSKVRIAKWGIQQNFTVHEDTTETAGKPEKKSLFGRKKKADDADKADNAANADKEAK